MSYPCALETPALIGLPPRLQSKLNIMLNRDDSVLFTWLTPVVLNLENAIRFARAAGPPRISAMFAGKHHSLSNLPRFSLNPCVCLML
jgi:hypothetical protein